MEYMTNGLLLKQIHDSLEKQANNQLRPKDLTMMQVVVLMAIRESSEKLLSMKEIEHHFQVAQSTIAGIVTRLEKKGFVEASGDITDKRIKLVRITTDGEKCCEEAEKYMHEAEEMLMHGFTKEERTMFHTLLTRVASNVK
ncbi:MAG: MarR family winged helix-turn-helix transcriptional regulator [Lachnospiraceae bacterium]